MGDPRAVQGLFDAAVARPDNVRRHSTDKRIERLRTDGVDHTLPDLLGVDTRSGEAFRQHCLVILPDLWPTHMVRSVACATSDVRVDRSRTENRHANIGAFKFVLQTLRQ